jgi:surface antigen
MTMKSIATITACCALLLAVGQAQAQQKMGFLGESLNLSESDKEAQQAAARHALNDLGDGDVANWENAETGHSGSIMPTATYELKGLNCRDFRMIIRAARTRNLSLTACVVEDGTWKLYF